MPSPMVLGLDVATVTGFAYGRVDANRPTWGCKRLGSASSPSAEVFGVALNWARDFFPQIKPDVVMIEALLPPSAMREKTTRAVRDRLCGLNAIMMAVAHDIGVGEIGCAPVSDIRDHFIYGHTLTRKLVKAAVVAKCKELDWHVSNDNEADACAAWSYATALINPKLALRGSPLFNRIASIW